MHILTLCGALHRDSGNSRLLKRIQTLSGPEVTVEHDVLLGQLPLFNLDLESEVAHETVTKFRLQLAACDAVLIACPEYAFSLSGALKNGIDWVVGSGELERKLVAATALVAGPSRGLLGMQALEQTLGALSCEIAWNRPIAKSEPDEVLEELLAALTSAHKLR